MRKGFKGHRYSISLRTLCFHPPPPPPLRGAHLFITAESMNNLPIKQRLLEKQVVYLQK